MLHLAERVKWRLLAGKDSRCCDARSQGRHGFRTTVMQAIAASKHSAQLPSPSTADAPCDSRIGRPEPTWQPPQASSDTQLRKVGKRVRVVSSLFSPLPPSPPASPPTEAALQHSRQPCRNESATGPPGSCSAQRNACLGPQFLAQSNRFGLDHEWSDAALEEYLEHLQRHAAASSIQAAVRRRRQRRCGAFRCLPARNSCSASGLVNTLRSSPRKLKRSASRLMNQFRGLLREDGAAFEKLKRRERAARHWHRAEHYKTHVVFSVRWYQDVNEPRKRLWLAFRQSHSLLTGLVFRGSMGRTRAETVMVFFNCLAFELLVLCAMYSSPATEGPMVINPVSVVASGAVAAMLCIPAAWVIAWLFEPRAFALLPFRLLAALSHKRTGPTPGDSVPTAAPLIDLDSADLESGQPGCIHHTLTSHVPKAAAVVEVMERGHQKSCEEHAARHFSYASLNEYLLRRSVAQSWKLGDRKRAVELVFAWTLQLLLFVSLLVVFNTYGCVFASMASSEVDKAIFLSWGFSIFQRFVINEPGMIFVTRAMPTLLASDACSNVCNESLANTVGMVFDMVVKVLRVLSPRG